MATDVRRNPVFERRLRLQVHWHEERWVRYHKTATGEVCLDATNPQWSSAPTRVNVVL